MAETNQPPADLIGQIGFLMSEKLMAPATSPDDDLLSTGLLDSMSLIQLLVSLEEHFEIHIPLDEVEIEDIRSVQSIARLIASRICAQSGSATG